MPTFIENGCESFLWLTDTSESSAVDALFAGANWVLSNPITTYSTSGPYSENRSLRFKFSDRTATKSLGTNYAEFHFNGHFYCGNLPTNNIIVSFLDGTTNQIELRINSAGDLILTRNGTTLATASSVVVNGRWYFLQLRITIADAGGIGIVRLNNVEIINFTGDTKNTTNAYVNNFRLHGYAFWSNIVMYSDSASWPLEECQWKRGAPDAAGNYSQFTPLASTNVSQIDEQQPDADTTYNSSTTPGNKDSFGTDFSIGSGETILVTSEEIWIAKSDAGARDIRTLLRISSTDYESSSYSASSGYTLFRNLRSVSPATAAAWTPTELNALEVGYKDHA